MKKNTQKPEVKKWVKVAAISSFIFFCLAVGTLIGFYYRESRNQSPGKVMVSQTNMPLEQIPQTGNSVSPQDASEGIRSPLNGIQLSSDQFSINMEHIPHAVLISNNASARDEQYGLSLADIVYEAEVEGGITRFMAIFWNNQEGFLIKPVRSVRKYFFDWAVEYGNMPVTFSGFAQTDREDTNARAFYQKQDIRVTYWDWPLIRDQECLKDHPSMHCKYTTPELLYEVFTKHGWTYESWIGFESGSMWKFDEMLDYSFGYEDVDTVAYDFGWENEWSSRWDYDSFRKVYTKYDYEGLHMDIATGSPIRASTVVIQKMDREYTYDAENRVAYATVGSGTTYILRDGVRIDGVWEKQCDTCRTRYYENLADGEKGGEIAFKPGLIWIAAVPSDKEVRWDGTITLQKD